MVQKNRKTENSIMTDRLHHFLYVAIIVFLVISGCAKKPKPLQMPPAPPSESRAFISHLAVAPNVNPDHEGRSSPVVVKIYQLKSVNSFQNADFFSLYDEGKAVLGDDLIMVEERELQPGINYDYSVDADPKARFIAIVAAFRDIEKSQWRVVTKLPEKDFFDFMKNRILQIDVAELSVSAVFVQR